MSVRTAAVFCTLLAMTPATAAPTLTAEEINQAAFDGGDLPEGQSPLIVKIQILLDRAHASPGVIDGYSGENVEKGIRAFEEMNGLDPDGEMDEEVWSALAKETVVIVPYTITEGDLAHLSEKIPEDYGAMAEMDRLGFTSVEEKLAERFHMDIDLLRALNPDADFSVAGTRIMVADPGENQDKKVARLEADKARRELRAYDEGGKLVAAYPVSIGSKQMPSPSGTHEVVALAIEPTYHYRPDVNYQQGDNTEPLTLPPGPNSPVGLVWIDLSEPTYGIHGTPEPSKVDKEQSHGCIRMTNWDVSELAELVSKGVTVEFVED